MARGGGGGMADPKIAGPTLAASAGPASVSCRMWLLWSRPTIGVTIEVQFVNSSSSYSSLGFPRLYM